MREGILVPVFLALAFLALGCVAPEKYSHYPFSLPMTLEQEAREEPEALEEELEVPEEGLRVVEEGGEAVEGAEAEVEAVGGDCLDTEYARLRKVIMHEGSRVECLLGTDGRFYTLLGGDIYSSGSIGADYYVELVLLDENNTVIALDQVNEGVVDFGILENPVWIREVRKRE